ncbi:hypothetical protein FRX31_007415 [Thalictrum thalictroides]|uniref:Uncharacterized protein n=1 Tax=Thalictrum thalictroides TaxID=46969 RepID=A0A7J6X2H6_THATH|nr:hypothetical protein FRX31_007415 [Thalictrum thalictroides]
MLELEGEGEFKHSYYEVRIVISGPDDEEGGPTSVVDYINIHKLSDGKPLRELVLNKRLREIAPLGGTVEVGCLVEYRFENGWWRDDEAPGKLARVELPSSNFVSGVVGRAVGVGFSPQSIFGAMQPIYNFAMAVPPPGWPIPPCPQPWY